MHREGKRSYNTLPFLAAPRSGPLTTQPCAAGRHSSQALALLVESTKPPQPRWKGGRVRSPQPTLSCIEAGLGVGFVSEWALLRRLERHGLATLRLNTGKISRTFALVSAQGPELQSSAATLKHFLQSVVPSKPRQHQAKIGSVSSGQAGKALHTKKSSNVPSGKTS